MFHARRYSETLRNFRTEDDADWGWGRAGEFPALSRLRRQVPRDWFEYYGRVSSIRLVHTYLVIYAHNRTSIHRGLHATVQTVCTNICAQRAARTRYHRSVYTDNASEQMLCDDALTLILIGLTIGYGRRGQFIFHENDEPTCGLMQFFVGQLAQA